MYLKSVGKRDWYYLTKTYDKLIYLNVYVVGLNAKQVADASNRFLASFTAPISRALLERWYVFVQCRNDHKRVDALLAYL